MRKRKSYRPSAQHSEDTMWLVKYGLHLHQKHGLRGPEPMRLDRLSPSKAIAIQVNRLWHEQVRADDEKHWNNSSALGSAVMTLTKAYYSLAVMEDEPCVLDGEPQNGAVIR